MIKKLFQIFVMLILIVFNVFSKNYPNIGINLDQANAFVNIINNTNRYANATGFDSLGWAQSDFDLVLNDGRPVAEWSNIIDDPEVYRIDYSGTYKSSFKGIANISISGSNSKIQNKKYDSISNLTTFEIFVPYSLTSNQGFVYMTFRNTKKTLYSMFNSGISELKVMKPGYELNTDKTFTDEYIKLLKSADFACYRYYGVQNVWDSEPIYPKSTKWKNRKSPNDASQISMKDINGKLDGWCWEYIIELSNILRKDIWINISISADSDYVYNLASMLKTQLDPNINLYIENSNEVWSPTQAPFGTYNKAQADYYKINFDQNYARRCVELSNWFGSVFGTDQINKRIRVILGAQQYWSGRSDTYFSYINSNFGSPNKFIYALSISLYFGTTYANGNTNLVNTGMVDDINSQIYDVTSGAYRMNHINKAKKWNLIGGCVSYEGGPGVPSGGDTSNLANLILANRTIRMKEIINKNYADGWFELGGSLANYFTLFSGYNRYGCWGLTDDYNNPERNFKFQAIRELIGIPSSIDYSHSILFNTPKIEINPNPTFGKINLIYKSDSNKLINIKIINQLGIITLDLENLTANIGDNSYSINLNGLASGYYLLNIGQEVTSLILY